MRQLITSLIMLVVGFAMGQMSAGLFDINPWALSMFVLGLGLTLGYYSRKMEVQQ